MLKTDRFQAIMSLLEVNGTVRVSDIMEKFSVSDMTVRRDLDEMEKQGLLERVHGGAKLKDFYRHVELSHREKQIMLQEEKQRIVEKANEMINDVIRYFLDQELQSSSCQKSFKGIHCGLLQTVCLFLKN